MLPPEAMPDDLPGGTIPLLVAADLQDHLMVASNDLDRLQRLLSDTCDALMQRFYGASAELSKAMETNNGSVDGTAVAAALQQLGGAVTALQFQDMASQLIHHTHRRLRNCADQLARDAMGDDDEDGAAVVEEAPLRPNPVTQDEMDAGSIELF